MPIASAPRRRRLVDDGFVPGDVELSVGGDIGNAVNEAVGVRDHHTNRLASLVLFGTGCF
jgi:hypothetical protein